MRELLLITWLVATLCHPLSCLGAQPYPAVRPIERTFSVPDVRNADVSVVIQSHDGISLYRLQCHPAGYSDDPGFDYSGDFECRLTSAADHDTYSTLLTEDPHQSRDWESRARFFSNDLRGRCALVPEFGAKRTFRLRQMQLTLQVIDPKFSASGELASLNLQVTVTSDPLAHRAIAEIVPLPADSQSECKLKELFVDPSTFGEK